MANLIKIKRGLKVSLPTLNQGEPAFCTDTYELFIGDGATNRRIGSPDAFMKSEGGTISGNTTYSNANVILSGTSALTLALDPTQAMHAVTKQYVDAVQTGLDIKESCRVATTANLSATFASNQLTATSNGAISIDGVSLVLNDRVLVTDQTTGSQNGIYYVNQVGDAGNPYILTRATDFDSSAEVTSGAFTFIEEGTVKADNGYVLTTNNPVTLNTTALTFTQFSGAGQVVAGNGLTKTGNTLDIGAGNGIQVDADSVTVKLDGATLTKGVNGLKVSSGGVTEAEIAGSVAGDGLRGGNGTPIAVGTASSARIVVGADSIDLATTGVTPGAYNKVTVDAYGRATVGATTNLDEVNDGATYGRVLNSDLLSSRVKQIFDGTNTLVPSGTDKAGFYIGANTTDNSISTSASGSGSTTMYVGNQSILVSNSVVDGGTW